MYIYKSIIIYNSTLLVGKSLFHVRVRLTIDTRKTKVSQFFDCVFNFPLELRACIYF